MLDTFKDILVPVDFSINTEVAIKHAIELASGRGSVIHLLHVIESTTKRAFLSLESGLLAEEYDNTEISRKLMQWKQTIEETIPYSNVKMHIVEGSVQDIILESAKKINPQLIIIGRQRDPGFFSFFSSVYPNELAKLTDCPVLTVTKGSANSKIKLIVVPVRSFVPERKIELIVLFAKIARARIHLVTLEKNIGSDCTEKSALLDTFRILKTVLNGTIKYHLLKGRNFPKATLRYAEKIGADMILVNPWSETQISKLTGKHIQSVLTDSSKLKVLSVEPYHTLNNIQF